MVNTYLVEKSLHLNLPHLVNIFFKETCKLSLASSFLSVLDALFSVNFRWTEVWSNIYELKLQGKVYVQTIDTDLIFRILKQSWFIRFDKNYYIWYHDGQNFTMANLLCVWERERERGSDISMFLQRTHTVFSAWFSPFDTCIHTGNVVLKQRKHS